MKKYFFGLLGLFALSSPPPAQRLKLLGDLNTNAYKLHSSQPKGYVYDPTPGVSPERFLSTGTRVFFQADDGSHGSELWVSGTAPGSVRLLKDIVPGPAGSKPGPFCLFQGKVLFGARTPGAGWEPWISDGTPSGTKLLADLVPGKGDGGFYYPVILGTSLYFFAKTNTNPVVYGLYRYGGGAKTPVLVKSGFTYPWYFPVPAGKYIAFLGTTGKNQGAVWVTDGTAGGTVSLLGSTPSKFSSLFQSPVASGNLVWFSAKDSQGWGIWKTDGKTASLVGRFHFPMQGWLPAHPLGSKIVFAGADPSFNPYVLDTKTGKVSLLKKISNNWAHGFDFPVLWKGYIYFVGADSTIQPYPTYSLWRTDGTPKGTVKVVPKCGGSHFVAGANYIFFRGGGSILWRTDGTPKGTIPLEKPPGGLYGTAPGYLTVVGTRLLYSSNDPKVGRELFASDGTPAGTKLLKDIYPGYDTFGSGAKLFTPGLSKCWFMADDTRNTDQKQELWVTEGTAAATRKILSTRINPPKFLFYHQDLVFFSSFTNGKWELWRSDGTASGTFPFFKSPDFYFKFEKPLSLGDRILFEGQTTLEGKEPWVTDGTAKGTTLLKDLVPGPYSGRFEGAVRLGRVAVFQANDGRMGKTLWVTDGTSQGTRPLLSDLNWCANLVKLGGHVLFEGRKNQSLSGIEAWITDGTPSGTRQLLDLYKGTGDGRFLHPFRVGGKVFFLGTDGFSGGSYFYYLYSTNGTPQGTHRVSNTLFTGIREIEGGESPWGIALSGGKALFWPVTLKKGNRGPWITDGTAKGTFLLKDFGRSYGAWTKVRAVPAGAGRAWFVPAGLYVPPFPTGQVWETDGTAKGTRKVPALLTSGLKSLLWPPALFKGKLLVTMDDLLHGPEPWLVEVGATARRVGRPSGTAELESGDPVLGGIFPLAFRGVPAGALPLLMLGLPGKNPLPLAQGENLYLDPAGGLFWAGPVPGGSIRWTVPNDPALAGVRLGAQGMVFPTGVPPLGLDLTNGVFLTLGN